MVLVMSLPLSLSQALQLEPTTGTQAAVVALHHHISLRPFCCPAGQPDSTGSVAVLTFRNGDSFPALALVRQWLVEWDCVLHLQILCPDGAKPVLQLLLPDDFKKKVLARVHQEHSHQGVERTLELLRRQ